MKYAKEGNSEKTHNKNPHWHFHFLEHNHKIKSNSTKNPLENHFDDARKTGAKVKTKEILKRYI